MGQKTPSPLLRLKMNRNFDLCWFQDPQFYAKLHLKDSQYRHYIQSLCSQLPSSIFSSRMFSSAFPKQSDLALFMYWPGMKKSVRSKVSPRLKESKQRIFQDLLSLKLRSSQTSMNQSSHHLYKIGTEKALPGSPSSKTLNQNFSGVDTNLKIIKTPHFESSAHFFNMYLIQSFKRSQSYRKALQDCIRIARESPSIQGIHIVCAGRFNGAERARLETRSWGQTSRQSFNTHLDYSAKPALTNTGLLGIKIWIRYVK